MNEVDNARGHKGGDSKGDLRSSRHGSSSCPEPRNSGGSPKEAGGFEAELVEGAKELALSSLHST